jgi:hypothetical protein
MQTNKNNNSYYSLAALIYEKRGLLVYLILGVALVAFEAINFSTTQYALQDLLGPVTFASIQWATILAIAFCGIDFAGIAKLFTPDIDLDGRSREAWYLFFAWLLAATMNAMLTWWGVSMALSQHTIRSTAIIDPRLILDAVPVIVAIMVWVTRVLLIGSFSRAGSRGGQPDQAGIDAAAWERIRTQRLRAQASVALRAQQSEPAPQPAQPASQSAFQRPQLSQPAPSPQPSFQRPQPAPLPGFRRPQSTTVPAPLVTSRPLPTPPAIRPVPEPHPAEPEYIPEDEEGSMPLPSLRPLTALTARPGNNNGEKRF